MKKLFLLFALLASIASTAIAVPPGSHLSKCGELKAIVHQGGEEIYLINRDEKVYMAQTDVKLNLEVKP